MDINLLLTSKHFDYSNQKHFKHKIVKHTVILVNVFSIFLLFPVYEADA